MVTDGRPVMTQQIRGGIVLSIQQQRTLICTSAFTNRAQVRILIVMTWGRFFISSTFGLTKYRSILFISQRTRYSVIVEIVTLKYLCNLIYKNCPFKLYLLNNTGMVSRPSKTVYLFIQVKM